MLQSQYSVCVLYIGQINPQALVQATQDNVTGLMNPRALPRHERQWTCRVWVETVLNYAASQRWIQLPAGMCTYLIPFPVALLLVLISVPCSDFLSLSLTATIELGALATADHCRAYMGNAVVISDYSWINRRDRVPCASSSSSRTTPMDIDSTGTRRRDHGGSKPMQGVEHYGRSSRSRR